MDTFGIVLSVVLAGGCIAIFWWMDRSTAKRDRKEDEEFSKAIAHLPIERQAELWQTHYRLRAEQDLH